MDHTFTPLAAEITVVKKMVNKSIAKPCDLNKQVKSEIMPDRYS